MATADNLMGLGLAHLLAARVGLNVRAVTCGGTSAGSATQLAGTPGLYFVNASNGGSGVALPQVGGDGIGKGILLGDPVEVANVIGATIYVYANANAAGSAVTLYGMGVSTAGTTGISVATGWEGIFKPVTVSTWVFTKVSA